MSDIAFLALAHWPPTELGGPVPLLGQVTADALSLARRVAKENRSIGPELLAEAAAQQLINRPFRGLADDVPQRDLNAAHRLDDRPLPAEKDRSLVHAMDQPIDLERVLADHALGQPATNLVRQRRLDNRLGDQ